MKPRWLAGVAISCAIALTSATAARSADTSGSAGASPDQSALESTTDDAFEVSHTFAARYYFESKLNGAGIAQYRLTFGKALSKRRSMKIYLPLVTSFAATRAPKSGLGNIAFVYTDSVKGQAFDHALVGELWLPTVTNGVKSDDTQVRPHYDVRWRWSNSGLSLENRFAQSVIVPPGSSWTSFYDLRATPYVSTARSGAVALLYEARVNFALGGIFVSAIGPSITANIGRATTLSAFDIWGIGGNGQANLWRYRVQAQVNAKL